MSRNLVEQSRAYLGLNNITVPEIIALARSGRTNCARSSYSIQQTYSCQEIRPIWMLLAQLSATKIEFVKIEKTRLPGPSQGELIIETADLLEGSTFARTNNKSTLLFIGPDKSRLSIKVDPGQKIFLTTVLGSLWSENLDRTTYSLGNIQFVAETIVSSDRYDERHFVTIIAHDPQGQLGQEKLESQLRYYAEFLGLSEKVRTSEPPPSPSCVDANFMEELKNS